MINSLDTLRTWDINKPEKIQEALQNLKDNANKYLEAKHKQNRTNPSALRNTRLQFAESLVIFADTSVTSAVKSSGPFP